MERHHDLQGITVLLVEDDPASLEKITRELTGIGADVHGTLRVDDAEKILSRGYIHVIIAAIDFIDQKFIEMMKNYKTRHPDNLFYVLTEQEYESIDTSQETLRLVVNDYIRKPLDVERFVIMVETSIGRPRTESTSLAVIDPLVKKVKPYFIFRSPIMKQTLAHLPQIASSDQTVLITGETGTGKEIIARAVHMLSSRSSGHFVPINCGAIPESLIEGDLFGHEKGAFTGATEMRKGKFEFGDKGTIFLDEIGEMPLNLQVRLLRVLEEQKVYRVGSVVPVPVNVRVIAASNTDLEKAVRDGLFRDDLYYRLNVLRLHLPPLRERVDDISLLAVHFLKRAFTEMNWTPPYPSLSSETIYLLERYPWRGNVRELRNVMTRVSTLLPRNTRRIFPFHVLPHLDDADRLFPPPPKEGTGQESVFIPIGTSMNDVEEELIRKTLNYTKGNKTKAASLLGISLRTLRRRLNK
jgi:DNA-binding NtrC family response regulator